MPIIWTALCSVSRLCATIFANSSPRPASKAPPACPRRHAPRCAPRCALRRARAASAVVAPLNRRWSMRGRAPLRTSVAPPS
eukprot:3972381-Prymnesium_polylepis.1